MVRERPDGTVVEVRVIPRASRSALAAPPVNGQANDALLVFLSGVLGLPRRALSIVHGDKARHKRVLITGMRPADVAARLTPSP